jgi:aerobic-type carbon monoxide dehydrogenase small subunit (CoxS/CutS family)
VPEAEPAPHRYDEKDGGVTMETVRLRLNDRRVDLEVDPERRLLWVLRTDLGLTGTKYGCGRGLCGACTVLVDGKAVRACRTRMKRVEGKDVTTIEGLARNGNLHPLQKAFVDLGGLQCGFCTPGIIMNAVGLLGKNPHPTREQIIRGMNGNLCRCGAHLRVFAAIEKAARAMQGGAR